MKITEVEKFLAKLLADCFVYAPVKKQSKVLVEKIENVKQVDWSGDIPFNSFKSLLLPPKQELFEIVKNKIKPIFSQQPTVAWGVNILDLQAFTLFEHIFEKDIYYQKQRQNTVVVGFTAGFESDFRKYKNLSKSYEDNVLEHVMFDIFIEKQKNGNFVIFSGSEKGQNILEKYNILNYENIKFAGLFSEKGLSPIIEQNKKLIFANENHPVWDKWAKICLACGKCSMICPTCFCFNQSDEVESDKINKVRKWASCFYPEFSKVAGGHKDLDTVKKKLYYWYYHKFVRIPDELGYFGCVGCGRCGEVCPVGIGVSKTMKILKGEK